MTRRQHPAHGGHRRVARRPIGAVVAASVTTVAVSLAATTGIGSAAVGTAVPASGRPARATTDPTLVIIDQPFVLASDQTIELRVQLPADADLADIVEDGTVVVTSHRPLSERHQVWDALDGSLPAVVDTIDLDVEFDTGIGQPTVQPDSPPIDPAAGVPTAGSVPTALLSPTGLLTLSLPTESRRRTRDALQFALPGIHPLVIDVRQDGRTEGALVTFVDRLAGADDDPPASIGLPAGLVIRPDAAPTIARDASIDLDDDAVTQFERLADALEALDGLPVLVDVDPTALDRLGETDRALMQRLTTLLEPTTLTARPRIPFDPSAAVVGGGEATYARLLDEGVELLTATVDGGDVGREVSVASSPLSTAGADLLRATGTETLVVPFDTYRSLDGSLGDYTDTTRTIAVTDSELRVSVVDPFLAPRFDDPGIDPRATAISIVAELIVLDRQIADARSEGDDEDGDGSNSSDGSSDGHGVLIGRSDLTPPTPALLTHLAALAADTAASSGVAFTDPVGITAAQQTMLVDDEPVRVQFAVDVPAPDGVDPSVRRLVLEALTADTAAVASMLDPDDERIAQWADVTDVMVSTAVDDRLATAMDSDVRRDLDRVRACVVPPERFAFTLTGRTSTIPITITNVCDVPITVRLQLNSPKISFPEGDQLVELLPGTATEERVRAEARTNGRSSVFLRLFTPLASGSAQQVAPDVVLTARVQSFAGLGQLLLGTFVLIVVAWWIRHWRETRRRAAVESNAHRHPAAGPSH